MRKRGVDGFISDMGSALLDKENKDWFNKGWSIYTEHALQYSAEGLAHAYMETSDTKLTINRNQNKEAMENYNKQNNTLDGFNFSNAAGNWMERFYQYQMKFGTNFNNKVFTPTINSISPEYNMYRY